MAVMPITHRFVEQKWRGSGRRYFAYVWALENYNDVILQCPVPQDLITNSIDCSVMVTDVGIMHLGTIGVLLNPIYTFNPGNIFFPSHTTALATDVHYIPNLQWVLSKEVFQTQNTILNMIPQGYLATDDVAVFITGFLEKELLEGTMPVSLEGYKWPLTKRR